MPALPDMRAARRASDTEQVGVIAGVDEAGLGPLLGPLTIGYSAFRVPHARIDPWEALRALVSRRPESDRRRIVVADSKLVFTRNERGARRLERTALAFLALDAQCRVAGSARELLEHLCAPFPGAPRANGANGATGAPVAIGAPLAGEAWFPHLAARLPACCERGSLEIVVARLVRALQAAELELVSAGVRVLPVGELNASFDATNNKSVSHWNASAPVLRHLWERHAHVGLEVMVDRHGGRMRYASLLRTSFPECAVEVVHERATHSQYVLTGAGAARMRVSFAEKADRDSFAVALASCFAKYVRETCMHAFNAYFGSLQPELRPTAGYNTDGWRWMREAAPAIERSGIPRDALVRAR